MVEPELVLEVVAARHDAGGAVGLGEVGERPDGVALHLVAPGERKEVERPLVAVHGLGGLARSDGDQLREVQLEAGGMAEDPARRGEDERVGHHLARRCGAGDEGAGASGVVAREVVGPGGRGFGEGSDLVVEPVEQPRGRDLVDDAGAVAGQDLRDLLGPSGGR